MPSSPFKANDIRGQVPEQIDNAFAHALGQAICRYLGAKKAVTGHDCRLSGPGLENALIDGLVSGGAQVSTLGMCCTEEIYNASINTDADCAIMITASHNPANENGFKIMLKNGVPVTGAALKDLEAEVARTYASVPKQDRQAPHMPLTGHLRDEYVNWLLSFCQTGKGRRLKIVADAGNGCAGLLLGKIAAAAPFDLEIINGDPDGTFPNGVPNPLLPEKRAAAANAVTARNADFGCAFDGDADRCFFFDHTGRFVEGYYMVALLGGEMAARFPGRKIYHDTRLYWKTENAILANGGVPITGKAGHGRIKKLMREENAVYGGELSGHHYFGDFGFCDSGILPFMLVASLVAKSGKSLAEMVEEGRRDFPCSDEINFTAANAAAVLEKARLHYLPMASKEDYTDGLNLEFPLWRFSLRRSATEPLLRLNLETRGSRDILKEKIQELTRNLEIWAQE